MITRLTSILLLLLVTTVSASFAQSAKPDATPPDPILGNWVWPKGYPVTITADGKAVSPRGPRATWKFLNNREVERKYEFIWDQGKFIDTVKLSRDGQKLEGKNQNGDRVWAARVHSE